MTIEGARRGGESSRQATLLFWFRLLRDELCLAMCSLSVFTCVSNVLFMLLRPTSPLFFCDDVSELPQRSASTDSVMARFMWVNKGQKRRATVMRRLMIWGPQEGRHRRQKCLKLTPCDALEATQKAFRISFFFSFVRSGEQGKAFSRMKDALGCSEWKAEEKYFHSFRPTIPSRKATLTPFALLPRRISRASGLILFRVSRAASPSSPPLTHLVGKWWIFFMPISLASTENYLEETRRIEKEKKKFRLGTAQPGWIFMKGFFGLLAC